MLTYSLLSSQSESSPRNVHEVPRRALKLLNGILAKFQKKRKKT